MNVDRYDFLASNGVRDQLHSAEAELAEGSTIICADDATADLIDELAPFLIRPN